MTDSPNSAAGTSTQEQEKQNPANRVIFREQIALYVLLTSLAAVLLTSIVVVNLASEGDERMETSRRVMDSTLPLYGTWVGTILAFYFSTNAFVAASNSALQVQKVTNDAALGSSAAGTEDKLSNIALKSLANGLVISEVDQDKSLRELVDELQAKGRYRVIVVDSEKKFTGLVYRTNAAAYLEQQPSEDAGETSPTVASPTLRDYLGWQEKANKPPVVFLPETATLADADAKMKAKMGCRDVIVTTDEKETSPVVAYVTDFDIEQYK